MHVHAEQGGGGTYGVGGGEGGVGVVHFHTPLFSLLLSHSPFAGNRVGSVQGTGEGGTTGVREQG